MFAIADFWIRTDAPDRTAPEAQKRPQPLLMGDIVVQRGAEPEFLIRWREDRARLTDER